MAESPSDLGDSVPFEALPRSRLRAVAADDRQHPIRASVINGSIFPAGRRVVPTFREPRKCMSDSQDRGALTMSIATEFDIPTTLPLETDHDHSEHLREKLEPTRSFDIFVDPNHVTH